MSAQQTAQNAAREAGWFADPLDDARIRYWNGESWTHQTADRLELPPPVGSPMPAPVPPTPTPAAAAAPAAAMPSAPAAAAYGAQPYGQPGYGPAPYGTQEYQYRNQGQAAPRGAGGKPGKAKRGRSGSGSVGLRANMFTTAAVVLGILALIFMPLYVGVVAIASAAVAFVRGERRAATGLKVAIIGMVIGIAWAYASARFGLAI